MKNVIALHKRAPEERHIYRNMNEMNISRAACLRLKTKHLPERR